MPRLLQTLILALIAALAFTSSASATSPKTALRADRQFSQHRVGKDSSYLRETPQQITLGYGGFASDSPLASRGVTKIDPNKLHHIFGKSGHGLGSLVEKFGSQEATFSAVQEATQAVVKGKGISGVFETTVSVGGHNVVVRGRVMDGIARIGTFFIP
jgi:hypothetical protein